ncbi:MAG: hypothetical protein DRG78_03935 [Epsilonproteobacteria bacterium]|nr:MAG: hypothetical protein DRG78_03935 [Campylobacterota bacterium]
MYNLGRINKECFWDYHFKNEEILKIAEGDNIREKKFLFAKILLNSTEMFQDLEIFCHDDLEQFINEFQVSSFNYDYIFKRKNVAEVYFLDKELLVDELRWTA